MDGACSKHNLRNPHNILFEKPERKRPLGKHRQRWENNTKMDLREIGREMWAGFIWLKIGTSGGLF
jgi:hypothetical protein